MLHEFHDQIPDGLETKVFTEKYLPEALPLDDPRKADIKLGQLLSMSAGYWGEGQAPQGYVMGKVTQLKPVKGQDIHDLDMSSLRVPLWTDPGAGYSYSSPSPHIASIVLRHVTGMELQDYINERLAKPMGWGTVGLLPAPRRFLHAARQRRRQHRAARDGCNALRLLPAAPGQMEGPATRAARLHRAVPSDVALQSAHALQPAV
ncbi:MAG: serine hydrolase domain-containing protein [Chthoniobacter sp.]